MNDDMGQLSHLFAMDDALLKFNLTAFADSARGSRSVWGATDLHLTR